MPEPPRLAHAARHQAADPACVLRLPTGSLMHADTADQGRLLCIGLGFLGLDVARAASEPMAEGDEVFVSVEPGIAC